MNPMPAAWIAMNRRLINHDHGRDPQISRHVTAAGGGWHGTCPAGRRRPTPARSSVLPQNLKLARPSVVLGLVLLEDLPWRRWVGLA